MVVILVVVLALGSWAVQRQRSTRLRHRFGAEYDRTLERTGNRRAAEQELTRVADRRAALTIRPLTPDERNRWLQQGGVAQAHFVDAPAEAVSGARELLPALMRDRGYPTEDFEERASLLAADHPVVVSEYRAAEQAHGLQHAVVAAGTGALPGPVRRPGGACGRRARRPWPARRRGTARRACLRRHPGGGSWRTDGPS